MRVQLQLSPNHFFKNELLLTGSLSDILFMTTSGETIAAHSCVLRARSSYFRKLFDGMVLFGETTPYRVPAISGITKANLQSVLSFIYTDVISSVRSSDMRDNLQQLTLATRWKITALSAVFSHLTQNNSYFLTSPLHSLCDDMLSLLENEVACDVEFCCTGGVIVRAHRAIICASSLYFRALFCSGFAESNQTVVKLDVDASLFKLFLSFCYTQNWILLPDEKTENLLQMASYFIASTFEEELNASFSRVKITPDSLAELWLRGARESVISYVSTHFETLDLVNLPKELISLSLNAGIDMPVDSLIQKIVRYGCEVAGITFHENIRVCDHLELIKRLSGLLPPDVMFCTSNKQMLLGRLPTEIYSLV